ncbi:MAG: N-acyl homoserine lactonase family protein [Christensenella sp.]|nr:N-acyl homoserine lactonase family protein [Christensenella sp.]
MKGLEFAIIRYGYISNDLAWNVALPDPASKSCKDKKAIYGKFPCSMVLIKHPEEGYILYDVGEYPAEKPGDVKRPDYWEEYFALEAKREDYIDEQLKKIGLTPDDISAIIISHMHCDHANGLKFFSGTKAGQNVYVSRRDFEQGCLATFGEPDEAKTKSAYWRSIMTTPGITYHFIEEDTELFPGIHLFLLEGHTPGVLGMMLTLEGGNYFFPSDACGSRLNYGPPAKLPGIIYDSLGFERCIKKIRKLERDYDAKLIFSHDLKEDETYTHFPEFYK